MIYSCFWLGHVSGNVGVIVSASSICGGIRVVSNRHTAQFVYQFIYCLLLLFACGFLEANIFGFDLGRAGARRPLSHLIFVTGRIFSLMRSSRSMAKGRGILATVTLLVPVVIRVPRIAFFLSIFVSLFVVIVVIDLLPWVLRVEWYQ